MPEDLERELVAEALRKFPHQAEPSAPTAAVEALRALRRETERFTDRLESERLGEATPLLTNARARCRAIRTLLRKLEGREPPPVNATSAPATHPPRTDERK